MLAQSFKTAEDLDISEKHREALIKTLALFESGEMRHISYDVRNRSLTRDYDASFSGNFNMQGWSVRVPTDPIPSDYGAQRDCGTIACIGGTASLIGGVDFEIYASPGVRRSSLWQLFYPNVDIDQWDKITVEQAAMALRSYLTTGKPHWELALA